MKTKNQGEGLLFETELKKNVSGRERRQMMRRMRLEEARQSTEKYLSRHAKVLPGGMISTEDRRQMKRFFCGVLDKDGDGQVSAEELLSPLLGVRMAKDEAEVRQFVNRVDTDHSGFIDFSEFIRALEAHKRQNYLQRQVPRRGKQKKAYHKLAREENAFDDIVLPPVHEHDTRTLPLVRLQQADALLEVKTIVSIGRRQRLLEAVDTMLPNTARIEELSFLEAQQNIQHEHKPLLRSIRKERRSLENEIAHSAKLISAIDHAIRVDLQNDEKRKQRREAELTTAASSPVQAQLKLRDCAIVVPAESTAKKNSTVIKARSRAAAAWLAPKATTLLIDDT